METDIRKSNKIPGYNQLTRPEEIAALSKYLREIKKDPYIELDKNSLEVPGKDTPQVPEIGELSEEQIKLSSPINEPGLDNTKLKLDKGDSVELVNEKVNLNPAKDVRLETQTNKLEDTRNLRLENKSEKLSGEIQDLKLEKNSVKLKTATTESELETETEKLTNREKDGETLSDYIDSLASEPQDPKLVDSIYSITGDTDNVSSLYNSVLTPSSNQNQNPETLSNHKEELSDSNSVDGLGDTIISSTPPEELDNLENHKENINPEEIEDLHQTRVEELRAIIQDANSRLDDEGLYELALRLLRENEGSEWSERIASLMSAYLSGSRISPERANEYEERLLSSFVVPLQQTGDELELSENKEQLSDNENGKPEALPDSVMGLEKEDKGDLINEDGTQVGGKYLKIPAYSWTLGSALQNGASGFLRKTAEDTIGPWVSGSLRATLINETLGLLVQAREQTEKLLKINKDRLPGDDTTAIKAKALLGGLSGALGNIGYTSWDQKSGIGSLANNMIRGVVKKGLEDIFSGENSPSPLRRPEKSENDRGLKYGEEVNKIFNSYEKDSDFLKYFGGYYSQKPTGLNLTLQDLCDTKAIDVDSADKLLDILEKSPYITTAGKVNKGISRTLDSNMYWEVLMEPWVNDGSLVYEAINGGYSFLPSPREINTINLVEHGAKTEYNKWIPLSGFELQKSKLTTKSLGLFDGEINYPVTSEYTNEFRMTIVDDQWKSWKHYFQKCADVAVYNSEAHQADYYYEPDPIPTAVDKETMCAAFYKNITFLISVYIMTPQFFTARAFYLLCVLKDFSEDYMGEVDSGGTDLNVSFSIVGELDEKPMISKERLPITSRFSIDDLKGVNRIYDLIPKTELKQIPELKKRDSNVKDGNVNPMVADLWAEYKQRKAEGVIYGDGNIHWDTLGG